MYKYSIVIPVLNGARTLALTLPSMLENIVRDDVEWIVSDNHSDDSLYELVNSISDPRLRYIRPNVRLPVGKHLDYAYAHANGEWQSHIGHDDYIVPSRFSVLDELISSNADCNLIHARFARYHWPDFFDSNKANLLSSAGFSGRVCKYDGLDFGLSILNKKVISGGGSWVVNRKLIRKIRERMGYFSSDHSVEFFSMRAAAFSVDCIIDIDLPLWILGRANSSVGTQAFTPNAQYVNWDWDFETTNVSNYCPFQYDGYAVVSMDGALRAAEYIRYELPNIDIDHEIWNKHILSDLVGLEKKGKLKKTEVTRVLDKAIADGLMPYSIKLRYYLLVRKTWARGFCPKKIRDMASFSWIRRAPEEKSKNGLEDSFGWAEVDACERFSADNIVDLANSIDNEFLMPRIKSLHRHE